MPKPKNPRSDAPSSSSTAAASGDMYALRIEDQTRLDALRSAFSDNAQSGSLVLDSQGDNIGGKATFSVEVPCIVRKTTHINGDIGSLIAFEAEAKALLDVEVSTEGWPSELYLWDEMPGRYGQSVLEHLGYSNTTREPDTTLFPKLTSSIATFSLPPGRYPSTVLLSSEYGSLLEPITSLHRGTSTNRSNGQCSNARSTPDHQDTIDRLHQKSVRARIQPSDPNSIVATSPGDRGTESITGPASLTNAEDTTWPGEITVNITSTVTLAGLQWRQVPVKSSGSV
jgi:hypothetical protein